MKLNILSLNWNGAHHLNQLKETLLPNLEGLDWRWVIKDNFSKDDSLKIMDTWQNDNIKIIPYKDNKQNFAEGMNYNFDVAAPADNDLVMLLNNDIVFNDKNSIKNMVNIIQNDNSVGMVGCRLLYTNTNNLQHAGVVFDPKYKMPIHFRLNEKSDVHAEKNREFQVVTGAICLTRADYYKNVFTKNASGIKGMDEKYHWAFEDVDLCLSIKYNLEKKVVYCGQTNIFHEESAALKKNPVNKLFMNHNSNHLVQKWGKRFKIDGDLYKNSLYNLYK